MSTLLDRAEWLADKLHNGGDYGKEAAALLVKQAAEIERLQADAARYRWLRNVGDQTWPPFAKRSGTLGGVLVDAAIDAAIAASASPAERA